MIAVIVCNTGSENDVYLIMYLFIIVSLNFEYFEEGDKISSTGKNYGRI